MRYTRTFLIVSLSRFHDGQWSVELDAFADERVVTDDHHRVALQKTGSGYSHKSGARILTCFV
jgi:hypothetical protein